MQAQRWMIQPAQKIQAMAAPTKNKIAGKMRPWTSCPSPGKKRLHSAAMTLPPDPWPVDMGENIPAESSRRKRFRFLGQSIDHDLCCSAGGTIGVEA